MKKFLFCLSIILVPLCALATMNPCPDMVGVYFDEAANINCHNQVFGVPFFAYVVLTNPSLDGMAGVEFGYQVSANDPNNLIRIAEIIPPGDINIGDSTDWSSGDYILGWGTPIPLNGQAMTVVTWQFMMISPTAVDFYLEPSNPESYPDGYPAYVSSLGDLQPLGYSYGSGLYPLANLNGDCLLPATLTINTDPDGLNPPWQLEIPGSPNLLSGTGSTTLEGMPSGDYTLTWGNVPGWDTPDPNPAWGSVGPGGSISFNGFYQSELDLVAIDDVQEYLPDGTPNSPYNGMTVSVQGTVYVPAGTYNPGTHYIQDDTGGIAFFNDDLSFVPQVGDVVRVTGTVSPFAGEINLQLPEVQYLSSGQEPSPRDLTPDQVLADYENVGLFTRVTGTVASKSNNQFELQAGGPSNLSVFIDVDTGIDLSEVEVGDEYSVLGPVVVYNGTIELKPRFQSDLIEVPIWSSTVFSATARGGITQTGNTLGLSKETNANGPGTRGSIGTFLTTDIAVADLIPANPANPWFPGTTASWQENGSAANLELPGGATILHAELVWGGSYGYIDDVSAFLDSSVELIHESTNNMTVTPSPATAVTLDELSGSGVPVKYYVRSADVTDFVENNGPGNFEISGVPATQHESDNTRSAAGWALIVAYGLESAPQRFLEIRVGGDFVEELDPCLTIFNGFLTPTAGACEGRLLLSALEGDVGQIGDGVLIEYAPQSFIPLSSPGNPADNFFASQVNGIDGLLDISGSAGSRNHDASSAIPSVGARQGWDLTGIPLSSDAGQLTAGQARTTVQVATDGDQVVVCSVALQLDLEMGISAVNDRPIQPNFLLRCYPNPFNPQTTIEFELKDQAAVDLRVFDLSGRVVRNLLQEATLNSGRHQAVWNGRDDSGRQMASGAYFYRLETGEYSETKRMVLIK